MKFSVIGTGKTGGEVLKILPSHQVAGVFNSKTPPSRAALADSDVIIVFVPGQPMVELLPLLIESKKPVVCGSTGLQWPRDLNQTLIDQKNTWVVASNFSLGMNFVFHFARKLGKFSKNWPDPQLSIREVHHVHKKDCPSGTALTLRKMIDSEVEIEAIREGDVFGIHELTLHTSSEILSVKHEACDRSIFASGAISVAKKVGAGVLSPGLHFLEDSIEKLFPEAFDDSL